MIVTVKDNWKIMWDCGRQEYRVYRDNLLFMIGFKYKDVECYVT